MKGGVGQDARHVFRGDLVGQGGGDVDHEIDVVEVADGQGEVKEDDEEIDDDHHDLKQPQDPVFPHQFLEAAG